MSENSINSQWAKDEVIYAKNNGKKIIPILLKGASLNEGWFLFKFGRIDCIDTTNHSQVKKLVTNLSEWTNKPYSNEYSTQCNHKIPHDYNCTMIIDYSNNHYIKEIYNMGNLIKSELTPKYNTPIIEKINSNSEQNSSNDPRKPKYSPIIATIIFLAECIFAIIMFGISHKIHFDSDGIILACIFPIPCIFR